jgi:hypothetical protein
VAPVRAHPRAAPRTCCPEPSTASRPRAPLTRRPRPTRPWTSAGP